MAPKTKLYGRTLPSVVDDGSSICVTLTFPDILQYRAAFYGAIGELGKWYGWQHTQEDYSDPPTKNLEVAQLWSMVLANAQWGTCGMDCTTLATLVATCPEVHEELYAIIQNAINNIPTVQNALEEFFLANETIRNSLDQRYNVPSLNDSVSGGNFLKPDQCIDDYIFNQITVLVDLLDTVTNDLFQAIEVGTNQLERWAIATEGVPVFGAVVPVDEGLEFVDQLVEEVAEDYTGAWTASLRNDIRCELFCLAQNECSLTLDQAIIFYEDKVGSLSVEDPATLLQGIAQMIATGDFPGNLPVYLMHLLGLTLMKLAQNVFGTDFNDLYLEVIAAGDTPNNDWELLCATCPTDICVSLLDSPNGWYAGDEDGNPTSAFGRHVVGEGMAPNATTGGWNIGIVAGDMPPGNITAIKFVFNEPQSELYMARFGSDDFKLYPGSPSTEITMSAANTSGYFPFDSAVSSVRITSSTNILPTSTRLIEVCYTVG